MIIRNAVALSLVLMSLPAWARSPHHGEIVPVEAKYLFVPHGFDDNDQITVVLDGFLPSGCYKLTRPIVDTNLEKKLITITPQARFFDVACIEAMVPYNFEVALGELPQGDFEIKIKNGNLSKNLAVGASSVMAQDDHMYAPIDSVSIERENGKIFANLKVQQLAGLCLQRDDMRIFDHGQTIEVLPIIKTSAQPGCGTGSDDTLTWRVPLPSLTPGRKLLHVRSLNGKAINYVFSVPQA